jgi:hypothetical protein
MRAAAVVPGVTTRVSWWQTVPWLLIAGGLLGCSPAGERPGGIELAEGSALALDDVRLLDPVHGPSGPSRAIFSAPGPCARGRLCGDPHQGQIVAGAPADLVLLAADAFESLAALDRIEAVVLRGRVLDRAELDATLGSLEHTLPPG